MFAALTIERDPLTLYDLPAGFLEWVRVAGAFAAVGLTIFGLWLLLGPLLGQRPIDWKRVPKWQTTLMAVAAGVAAFGYVLYFALRLLGVGAVKSAALGQAAPHTSGLVFVLVVQTVAGAAALFAVLLPFARNFVRVRPRRVWALAKLSFKEAVRRRTLYAFSALLLVFLFASWFIPSKAEDQVRTYVHVVFFVMTFLLLFTAVVLAAFSIPVDIRQQTIHTIVTKPVERFEIVLGRFLGFFALMTLVLLVMCAVSLLYVVRGVNPEAAAESLKARMPLYGNLDFEQELAGNVVKRDKGENVGREWEYRSYISAPQPAQPTLLAVWAFNGLPASLAARDKPVRCEFGFDVYRTTKGQENKGISCGFAFYTWRFRPGDKTHYLEERRQLQAEGGKSDFAIDDALAEKYGYYEIPGKEITDYHTLFVEVPPGLFRNAEAQDEERRRELRSTNRGEPPQLAVKVGCNSATQFVGMAKYDLYLRLDDPGGSSEKWLFAANFFKGAFGLWLRLGLIIGVAVALSTYLSGVISLILALVLYLHGVCREFIQSVAFGTNAGGGPFEAGYRLSQRQMGVTPLDESTTSHMLGVSDEVFRVFVRVLLHLIPDVDRFDLTSYVAEGFNITGGQLFIHFLLLSAYMVPWAILAYYLIRWREIANPN
jgi:ABC-type transport system involved in multi-copper enzyme maturation permease subunit